MPPPPVPQMPPRTPRRPSPVAKTPVSATLTEVAKHWRVDVETARRVLGAKGVQDQETHAKPRYLWRDIWAIERAGALAGAAWPDTTTPLCTAIAAGEALDQDASTARRYANSGRLPATRLGPKLLRIHPAGLP
ncbi:hypothetical protein SAMN05444370_1468 [Rubrimonas cliftonensis]|uniref:Helix-turn-helix domain-containing protein n=2 Tax=Rubrimonas cliftonensis TaxID=89524 RepID=A0A1H4GAP8_9RHOB|nr:hypothetical protein SAMN05444370_1468 [Rubrimonas cliftonensis]